MTTLSLTTGYAIEALACLARQGSDSMLVREIAQSTGIPLPYLSKIFQRLGEAGIVETKRGYKGGVRLARRPAEICLLDIDAAVDNNRSEAGAGPSQDSPRSNSFWQAFHREYREKLAAMSLADVLTYEIQP